MKLIRIKPGLYRGGRYEVEDTYSPDGAPHTRSVTLTRDRWLLRVDGQSAHRFDTLREARDYVQYVQKRTQR